MITRSKDIRDTWWRGRGYDDCLANKAAIFRKKGNRVYAVGEHSNDWTVDEEHEIGSAYLEGYDYDIFKNT